MNAPVEAGLSPHVLSETHGGVRTLTMNRGERFNALSREMLAALERAIDDVGVDANVRAVVIAGAGAASARVQGVDRLTTGPVTAAEQLTA